MNETFHEEEHIKAVSTPCRSDQEVLLAREFAANEERLRARSSSVL